MEAGQSRLDYEGCSDFLHLCLQSFLFNMCLSFLMIERLCRVAGRFGVEGCRVSWEGAPSLLGVPEGLHSWWNRRILNIVSTKAMLAESLKIGIPGLHERQM